MCAQAKTLGLVRPCFSAIAPQTRPKEAGFAASTLDYKRAIEIYEQVPRGGSPQVPQTPSHHLLRLALPTWVQSLPPVETACRNFAITSAFWDALANSLLGSAAADTRTPEPLRDERDSVTLRPPSPFRPSLMVWPCAAPP